MRRWVVRLLLPAWFGLVAVSTGSGRTVEYELQPLLEDELPTVDFFGYDEGHTSAANWVEEPGTPDDLAPVVDQFGADGQPHVEQAPLQLEPDYSPDCAAGIEYCPECMGEAHCGVPCQQPVLRPGIAAMLWHPWIGGLRSPLEGETWLYRPFSAGWFAGFTQGSPLMHDWVGQKQGFFGGYRFGWDTSVNWGAETRFAFASVELYDSARAVAAREAMLDADNVPADGFLRTQFDVRRDVGLFFWDVSVLYYPWGDTAWRPYFTLGLGVARMTFVDRLNTHFNKTALSLPLGLGVKYRHNSWLVTRIQFTDNIVFGSGNGINTLNNISLDAGVEIRFGGSRRAYWPWNPGLHYW